jgi:hypothetical protein
MSSQLPVSAKGRLLTDNELNPYNKVDDIRSSTFFIFLADERNRTSNRLITNQLLYH